MSELGDVMLEDLGPLNGGYDEDTVSFNSDARSVGRSALNLCRRFTRDQNVYRVGPAPIEDEKLSDDFKQSVYPGALGTIASGVEDEASKAGSSGLLSYFAKLGASPVGELIDVTFIDSLIKGGADINVTDQFGQTIMHEVAREWHTDVAQFCYERFGDIDKPDNYGRSPLHLASAVNYPEMIEWLVNHGADIHRKTKGENQSAIHYAAKNNAIEALKMLLSLGAKMLDRDFKHQMPLFVAAEAGRIEACRYLLEMGAPAGIYNDSGVSALSIMIKKMPDVAKLALEQFQQIDNALRRKYYYLNYLELDTWRRNMSLKGAPLRQSFARSPLQAIVLYNELNLVGHPVILSSIQVKWKLFGKKSALIQLFINFFYTLILTGLSVTVPKSHTEPYYSPISSKWWRITLEMIAIVMTLAFIVKQFFDFRRIQSKAKMYNEWRIREIERDIQFCHPQWPEEKRFLMSERDQVTSSTASSIIEPWGVFEWITYIGVIVVMITRVIAVLLDNNSANYFHRRCVAISLIFIWLRLMKYCRAFQTLGPFITMLGHVIDATIKFGFLFFEVFIPYCCAFWILFGEKAGTEFQNFNDLIYQVFMMTLVADYEFSDLTSQDKIMAQLLVGTYLAIAGVVCLNLYIALMSETFARVWSEATANAYMSQASQLLIAESALGDRATEKIYQYIVRECSPLIVQETSELDSAYNEKELIMSLTHKIDEMNIALEKSVTDTTKLNDEVNALRQEVTQLRNFDESKFGEILDIAKDTSLSKIKSAFSTMQEGIGAKVRNTLFSKDKPKEDDKSIFEDDDDDMRPQASFFQKKKFF